MLQSGAPEYRLVPVLKMHTVERQFFTTRNYVVIIETKDGNTVIQVLNILIPGKLRNPTTGISFDTGPFDSSEDALDALDQLQPDEDER